MDLWQWDEIVGGWAIWEGGWDSYDKQASEDEDDCWKMVAQHGPVTENRSCRGHLSLVVEASSVEEAHRLVKEHYKGAGYWEDDDGNPFLAE